MNLISIWYVWVIVTLVWFGIVEYLAITNTVQGDTLSECIRRWLGITPHKKYAIFGAVFFLGFIGWFTLHITTNVF